MEISLQNAAVEPDPFHDLYIPAELEENLQRHRQNLARLVLSLRSAGVNAADIEESVSILVESYRDELIRTVKGMMK